MKEIKTSIIIIIGVVIAIIAGVFIGRNFPKVIHTTDIPPCDIYNTDQNEDWCQPYINFGYANGAITAKRIMSENEQLCNTPSLAGTPSDNCLPGLNPRQVIDELYEANQDKSYPHFPAGIKQKDGSYRFVHY